MKRLNVIAVTVLVAGCLIGAQTARAFVAPAIVGAQFISTAGSVIASGAGAIGAVIGAVLLLNGDTQDPVMRIDLSPSMPPAVPVGWTADPNPVNEPHPPGSVSPTTVYCITSAGVCSADSGTGLTAAYVAYLNGGSTRSCVEAFGLGGSAPTHFVIYDSGHYREICDDTIGGGITAVPGGTPNTTCPTGYGLSGGSCTVTSEPDVVKPVDNRCGLKFSAGTMSFDSRDPDCTGTPPAQVVVAPDGKTVTQTGSTPSSRVKVEVKPDGSVEVTTWTPSPGGNTSVQVTTISAPGGAGGPQVVSQATGTATGTGGAALTATPTIGTTTNSSGAFPDDYAREGTLQTTNTRLNTLHDDISKSDATQPSLPAARTQSEIEGVWKVPLTDAFAGLSGWTLPVRSVSCPTLSFSALGHSFVMDSHCSILETYRAQFQALCVLAFVLGALFIILGA